MMQVLSRLWRPQHPMFWLLVLLQLLSAIYMLILQGADPALVIKWMLNVLVLLNTGLSGYITWRLVTR